MRHGGVTARRCHVAVLCAVLGVALAGSAASGHVAGVRVRASPEPSLVNRSLEDSRSHEEIHAATTPRARVVARSERSRPAPLGAETWFAAVASLLVVGVWIGTRRSRPPWSWRLWWAGNALWRGPPALRLT